MKVLVFCFCCFMASFCKAETLGTVRVGVLQYGTLNWEMELIQQKQLAEAYQLRVEPVYLSSSQALLVALQGGKVDVILNDWLWVAKQSAAGRHYYFSPYSSNAGVLITQPQLSFEQAEQWRGKRLGIAGGKVNKNFILYSAYFQQRFGLDLAQDLELIFAAPPLLNALMAQGKLDAVINFWHYAAQLSAQGMATALTMDEVIAISGQTESVPTLGWVFNHQFADASVQRINAFLAMSQHAAQQLLSDDEQWRQLSSFTDVYEPSVRPYLIQAYRSGRMTTLTPAISKGIENLYSFLRTLPQGAALTGTAASLPAQLLWPAQYIRVNGVYTCASPYTAYLLVFPLPCCWGGCSGS